MKYNDEQKQFRMDETIKVTKLLRIYCRKKGILLKDVADMLGFSANTMSKWMGGAAAASRQAVMKIIDFVEAEYPNLSKMDEDDVDLMTSFGKYPTIDLNLVVQAMSQQMESIPDYAARNSIGASYFKDGQKGVDFGVVATGRRVIGMEITTGISFMVRANASIANGRMVLTVHRDGDVLYCGRVYRDENNGQIVILHNDDRRELLRLPFYNDKLYGLLLVRQIHKDERNTSIDIGGSPLDNSLKSN